jgi:hypothetical protein
MTTAALLLAAACGATEDVRLRLTDTDGDCTAATFGQVRTLSIEAVATAGRCRLAHECAFNVTAASPADIEAALRASGMLLELDPDEAQTLVINGRPLNDCFPREADRNHPVLCAYASLDQARDGTLDLELEADGGGACPESIELCPP